MDRSKHISTSYFFLCAILAGLGLVAGCTPKPAKETLPIYRLSPPPKVSEELVQDLASKTLGINAKVAPEITRDQKRLRLLSDDKVVEVYIKTGGIWIADRAQMWNPELKPNLPGEEAARKIADEFFEKTGLLPKPKKDEPLTVSFAGMGATHAAFLDTATKKREDRKLDVQVNYASKIHISRKGKTRLDLPIVGGGGEFNLTLGDKGTVIGYSGVHRAVEAIETESAVIPKARADEQFKDMVKGMDIVSLDSFLAYYLAPASVEQKHLYPVYVYRATARIDKEAVPLRLVTLPATEFGPKPVKPRPLPRRTNENVPEKGTTLPEGREEQAVLKSPAVLGSIVRDAVAQSSWREAGTSWIGVSGGLSGSQNNAKGFVDELAADGWNVNFNWGDAAAWESDWRRNDDNWVDAADFVFYTGHANMNGWVLRDPDDGFLHSNEIGTNPASPGDLWGQQDLEWIIVAACGPLQDNVLAAGGGDVFDRWNGAFDGLHQLLGYGAVTYDNQEEGKTVVGYGRDGDTLINAWFRAAREIQPSTNGYPAPDGPDIWAGVMYAYRSGTTSPGNDHIWGHGSVAPDPSLPNVYVAIWTTT